MQVKQKYLRWKLKATFTSPIITGTSINGPITAANATPELIPKTATATAIADTLSQPFDGTVVLHVGSEGLTLQGANDVADAMGTLAISTASLLPGT